MERQEAIDRLRENQEEIGILVHEANKIIQEAAPGEYERARRYWAAPNEGALSKSYGWLGWFFVNIDSSIEAIEVDQ